jgi:hypothetical protein
MIFISGMCLCKTGRATSIEAWSALVSMVAGKTIHAKRSRASRTVRMRDQEIMNLVYIRSSTTAAPCPPPTQRVATP